MMTDLLYSLLLKFGFLPNITCRICIHLGSHVVVRSMEKKTQESKSECLVKESVRCDSDSGRFGKSGLLISSSSSSLWPKYR